MGELDSPSCRSLTPSSTGPLILDRPTLLSLRFLAAHRRPRASIASSALLPTARLPFLASYIHAFNDRVTDSRITLRDEGIELSIREANG
jgi:hypothetical protein